MTKEIKVLKVAETMIVDKIYIIRNQKVMLDRDIAEMSGVETFRLNEAVKRNIKRVPEDLCFSLPKKSLNF